MRPDARLPKVAASFLEEDSNGWLVTFSDLVLQLFAFVLVAAVLGSGAGLDVRSRTPREPVARTTATAAASADAVGFDGPVVADALTLARFDVPDEPARVDPPTVPVRGERAPVPAAESRVVADAVPAPVVVARPEASLASELESFVHGAGLEESVQVAVNGGGVTLSISDTIGFASGRAELRPDAAPVLWEVHALVAARPDLVVEVSGHTDDRPLHAGSFRSNLDLSLARAARVAHELAAGDPELDERIFAAGYGAARPVAPNDDTVGRARNRRVELRLVPGDHPAVVTQVTQVARAR